ncbi:MAG TPA: hypothetical protein VJ943_15305, partial [Desulfotignum sp.]|nr:hypothetical protein [Desulfotignum sp.]
PHRIRHSQGDKSIIANHSAIGVPVWHNNGNYISLVFSIDSKAAVTAPGGFPIVFIGTSAVGLAAFEAFSCFFSRMHIYNNH